jgi:hypothetical protein
MLEQKTKFHWLEIKEVPALPGVYAWYYEHRISDLDIAKLEQDLAESTIDLVNSRKLVKDFIKQNILTFFQEEPYYVSLTGQLKPKYEGRIQNILQITEGLTKRIIKNPSRLKILQKILSESVPEFASPIYIGMAKNLSIRLWNHKKLIVDYSENKKKLIGIEELSEEDISDHNFAKEVKKRRFRLNQLSVRIKPIDSKFDTNAFLDAENILNRINYPLCGRN